MDGMTDEKSKDGTLDSGDRTEPTGARPVPPPRDMPDNVGTALRNAFQSAVEEDVPQAMLDLLRRLD